MTTTTEFAQARSFFPTKELMAREGGDLSAIKGTTDKGLISFVLGAETVVDPVVQKSLDTQKKYLVDLAGVGNAYARNQANTKKNPDLVYDLKLWQEIYNHLPLMGPSTFETQKFNQTITGVEIATAFIETIMAFAVSQGAALVAFADFLKGLGGNISAGIRTGAKTYTVATTAITLATQKVGAKTEVNGYMKGYWIDFSLNEKKIYSSCGSAERITIDFSYKYANSLFNIGALDNLTVKKDFEDFLSGTQIDDIKHAQNFFGGDFSKKS